MESYAIILAQFRQEVVAEFDAYYDFMKNDVVKNKDVITSSEKNDLLF